MTMINKNKYIILIILVIFYLLIRLPILISSIDKIHLDEELYRGNIAKELISGPILPFFDYQRSEYEGGSLVTGVLAVPFFLLFGKTLFSLKLVVLSFSVVMLIAWYLFLDKFFHRRIAILTTLLWIFSPPFYTKMSLYASGSYFEINLFTILAIFIFYQIFFIKERKWLFALLGLVSGFALFVSYFFSVTLLVILLFWFIFDKKFIFSKKFLVFSVFFLLGFSPWIYYNLTHNFEGLIVADKPMLHWFTKNSPFDSLIRFKNLFTTEIANSFGFQDSGFISHRLLSNIYYFIFAFSFCGLLFIYRRPLLKFVGGVIPYRRFAVAPKELPRPILLIMFFLTFCIILSFSGFEFRADFYSGYRYRYLIPTYPFIFALTAIFCHKMAITRKSIFISYFILSPVFILLILGLILNLNLVSIGNFGKSFMHTIYRGYNYYDLGKIICWRFSDSERSVELIKGIRIDDDRRYCYAGMGWGFGKGKFNSDYSFYIRYVLPRIDKQYWPSACERVGRIIGYDNTLVKELKDNLDTSYHPYFYRGFGAREAKRLVHDLKEYARLIVSINTEYQPYFHEGIGIELDETLFNDSEGFVQFMDALDDNFKLYIYKGLAEGREYYQFNYDKFGFGIGRIGYNIAKWNKIMDKIKDKYRPYCYQRLGIEIGWRFIHDIKKYRLFLEQADIVYRPSLYKGLGIGIGWRFGYNIDGCVHLIKEIDQKYWPFVYEGLGVGVARRYAYQLNDWVEEIKKVPAGYESYFDKGVGEAVEERGLILQRRYHS